MSPRPIVVAVAAGATVVDHRAPSPAANTVSYGVKYATPVGLTRRDLRSFRADAAAGPGALDSSRPRVPSLSVGSTLRIDPIGSHIHMETNNDLEVDESTPTMDDDNYTARWAFLVVAMGRSNCRCAARGAQGVGSVTGISSSRSTRASRRTRSSASSASCEDVDATGVDTGVRRCGAHRHARFVRRARRRRSPPRVGPAGRAPVLVLQSPSWIDEAPVLRPDGMVHSREEARGRHVPASGGAGWRETRRHRRRHARHDPRGHRPDPCAAAKTVRPTERVRMIGRSPILFEKGDRQASSAG